MLCTHGRQQLQRKGKTELALARYLFEVFRYRTGRFAEMTDAQAGL